MIWKRYFLKETIKIFFVVIFSFYFLYVFIDYTSRTQTFQPVSINKASCYYLCQFIKQIDLLLPLAILLSTIKVLTTLNLRNELIAMLASGNSIKKLLRPFIFVSLLSALFMYSNFEFIQPFAIDHVDAFEEAFFKKVRKNDPLNIIQMPDDSILIYEKFDFRNRVFANVFWYKNSDLMYRIETLKVGNNISIGKNIDIISREGKKLKKTAFFESEILPQIQYDLRAWSGFVRSPEAHSITQLIENVKTKDSKIVTTLLYKILIPLTCILVVIAPAPFCVRFRRSSSLFLIYALSIFGLIAFFTTIKACIILGENQIINPIFIMALPVILLFIVFGWKYVKL